MEELNISTRRSSYIIAAYSAAYTVMQPVAGYVLDVLGTKIGYAMFAVLSGRVLLVQPRWLVAGVAWRLLVVPSVPRKQRSSRHESQLQIVPGKERSIAVGFFNIVSGLVR